MIYLVRSSSGHVLHGSHEIAAAWELNPLGGFLVEERLEGTMVFKIYNFIGDAERT